MILPALATGLAATWKYRLEGREHQDRLRAMNKPVIYVLWHRHLLPITLLHRGEGIAAIVSRNRDGTLLADAMERWGYRTLRGSTSSGGSKAFREALRILESGGELAVTPDGPRGPAGVLGPGAIEAARKTAVPVIAMSAHPTRCWKLNSWDRFEVPYPFASVTVRYSEPLTLHSLSRDKAARLVTDALNDLSHPT